MNRGGVSWSNAWCLLLTAYCGCSSREAIPNRRQQYCDRFACPPTLTDALAAAKSCEQLFQQVLEFDDGTTCVGYWGDFGGFANCYVDGVLDSAFTYSDLVGVESGAGAFGDYPMCAFFYDGLHPSDHCDPMVISVCSSCWWPEVDGPPPCAGA